MVAILKYDLKNFGLKALFLHILGKLTGDNFRYEIYKQKILQPMSSEQLKPYIIENYIRLTGRNIDIENPTTINEKIQWMKVYNSTPLKTKLADKYAVREYVESCIGKEYLIPLLGVWNSFDEIDFEKLPEKFVLKTNHGSSTNIIVKDKNSFDKKDAKKKFDKWMKLDYAFKFDNFELHYRDIPRKIIAEEYIEQFGGDLFDYKFMCANGEILYIWVDTERYTNHKRNLFDTNWNLIDATIAYPKSEKQIPPPKNLKKMIEIAETLSNDFSLVRVDLYEAGEKVYFGELTFTSGDGVEETNPECFAVEMGKKVALPEKFILCAKKDPESDVKAES